MFLNENGKVRSGWLIASTLLIVYFGQGIFMLPGSTLLSLIEMSNKDVAIASDLSYVRKPWMILATFGAATLGGIAATLVAWRAINKQYPLALGLRGKLRDLFVGLLFGGVAITVIFLILLSTGNVTMETHFLHPNVTMFTVTFFILFVLVGFFEEMLFRGYVMKTMLERGNEKWLTYVVSALVFSLVHITNPNVSLLGLINIALAGLLFAYMFDMSGSLLLPIGYHITWNFFQGNVFGFSVSGISPYGLYEVDTSKGVDLLTGGAFGLEGGLAATIVLLFSFYVTKLYTKWQKRIPL
ncbi:MAG TPA: type II CAAX endopeptidase family protein [Pseudogracilibacillus sp.]|nr:type II CAAX endopeptidase family protein [Pseudogracilibacillus sp.]